MLGSGEVFLHCVTWWCGWVQFVWMVSIVQLCVVEFVTMNKLGVEYALFMGVLYLLFSSSLFKVLKFSHMRKFL